MNRRAPTFLEIAAKNQHNPAMPIRALTRRQFFPDPRARLAVSRQPVQHNVAQHRHEFFEIAVILSGGGTHVTGKLRHPIGAGDVLVINNRRAHGYADERGLNLVNLLIAGELINQIGRRLREVPAFHALFSLEPARWRRKEYRGRLTLTLSQLGQVEEWVNRLETELRRGDAAGHLAAEAWLTLIISLLVARYDRQPRQAAPPDSDSAMSRLLGWLEKNCAAPLTVGDLARQAGMSERNFYRAFRAAVGQTPLAYLTEARIRRAMDSLARSDIRVSEAAAVSGFDDSNYFSRVFRQVTGQTPRQFARHQAGR
ncbi:MAG: helix-turn-helix domain-containing protein [Verrucomicrobiales bacterium]|jgi:AraC-like DNA-binding protein/mannose-6-phosphate isomerase-like protein (cupin superfamily)|nr:helix-turn-helix domain-containing protein [Verrucomicrobiales bacterium]